MKTSKTIRINEGKTNHKSFLFPDHQPHIQLETNNISELVCEHGVEVVAPLRNSEEVMNLLLLSNALDHAFVKKTSLVIPYLLGARSDRVMSPGDSVCVEVMAELINSCKFERVNLFDVHSDVATALIKNSKNHNNSLLVKAYDKDDAVLIVPDAGAAKKVSKYLEWNPKIGRTVNCIKARDLVDKGKISLAVLNPQACQGRHCVIIDDLCDGGGTFIQIGEALKDNDIAPKSLTLIVSHGIFSKGFLELSQYFDEIITSDSYASEYNRIMLLQSPLSFNDRTVVNPMPDIHMKLTIVPIFSKL